MYSVYIVDDEPIILEGITALIEWEKLDLQVMGQAVNGQYALDFLKQHPVDILITDIRMPNMDGLTLIKKVKEHSPATKFIILSGYNDFEYVKSGITLGIENYLLKPINEQELYSTLENTVEKLKNTGELSILTENDSRILKNNILYRWVTNNIHPLELKERAELFHINLDKDYFRVCILKPFLQYTHLIEPHKSLDRDKLYRFILKTFKDKKDMISFKTPYDEIIIISTHSCHNPLGNESIESLRDLLWHIRITYEVTPFFSVGTTVEHYTEIEKSFTSAKQALEYRFFQEDHILYYDNLHKHKEIDIRQSVFEPDYDTLTQLILSKDNEGIEKYMDDLLLKIKSQAQLSSSLLMTTVIRVLLSIESFADKFNVHSVYPFHEKIVNQLYELGTLQDIKMFLLQVIHSLLKYIDTESNMSPIIRQLINDINLRYDEPLTLKNFSIQYKVNSTYLGQLFKKETGEIFSDYLNKYRIKKAKEMILNTNLKARDIALKVGYPDPNYFYRTFKKYVGLSPVELKNYKN